MSAPSDRARRVLALAEKATGGPWEPYFSVHGDPFVVPTSMPYLSSQIAEVGTGRKADAEFIAETRALAPLLAADVLRLEGERDEIEAAGKRERDQCDIEEARLVAEVARLTEERDRLRRALGTLSAQTDDSRVRRYIAEVVVGNMPPAAMLVAALASPPQETRPTVDEVCDRVRRGFENEAAACMARKAKTAWESLYNERNRSWRDAQDRIDLVAAELQRNGCDCECEHDAESHDDSCERCFACRVSEAVEVRG